MSIPKLDFFRENPDLVAVMKRRRWVYDFITNLLAEYQWGKITRVSDLSDKRQRKLNQIYFEWKDKTPTIK